MCRLTTELTHAHQPLPRARDGEVRAKHSFDAARWRALFSGECPKVARGGYTTAVRDSWVDEQVKTSRYQYDVAVAKREAAQDHLRVVRDQSMIVMALASSIRAAYAVAGSGR